MIKRLFRKSTPQEKQLKKQLKLIKAVFPELGAALEKLTKKKP